MKKLTLLAAILGLAVAAHAQAPFGLPFKAMGYDASTGGQVTGRMAMGAADLDLGVGLTYDGKDDGNDDNNLSLGLSAYYLIKAGKWGPVANHLALGGILLKLPQKDDNIRLSGFAGFQPEITLLDRIIISTRFGATLDVMPDIVLATAGQTISIVEGVNFKILF